MLSRLHHKENFRNGKIWCVNSEIYCTEAQVSVDKCTARDFVKGIYNIVEKLRKELTI